MSRVRIKICGIRDEAAIEAAVSARVDAVGFVFAPSPRRVTPAHAARLARRLPEGIETVAVVSSPSASTLARVVGELGPHWVQSEADDGPIVGAVGGCRFLPVYRNRAPEPGRENEPFLFEGARSGVGERADWRLARAAARRGRMILAGGLSQRNVADALERVRPWGVDVSSGVETAPGVKDPELIAAFAAAVRGARNPRTRPA